jgi:hypothetical protein
MSAGDKVLVRAGETPADYHCTCDYCKVVIGELRPADGSYYSRLERRQYYGGKEKGKGGHIAKTPLHVARWAIQTYSVEGDWVLDPTIGAGTTAVEAITQRRNVAGMELEYGDILVENVKKALTMEPAMKAHVGRGDARNIGPFLGELGARFTLVQNNPPYSGDVSMPSPSKDGRGKEHREKETRFDYDTSLPNIAFLKEGQEYWDTMEKIYSTCVDHLVPGGHFVIGVKDMVRKKEPFLLHKMYCDLMTRIGLEFVGTAFLKHYPGTLFLNSYEKMHGTKPPYYQTISEFRKEQ